MNCNDETESEMVGPRPSWMDKAPRKPRPPQALEKCAHCGEPFRLPRSRSIDAIDEVGLFCTLRCAARYGVWSAHALRRAIKVEEQQT